MIPPSASPMHPPARLNSKTAVLFALMLLVTTAVSLAALIVALNQPSANPAQTDTAAPNDSAEKSLCTRYKLAAHAVHMTTTGPGPDVDAGIAYTSFTNGALMLQTAIADSPLTPQYLDAAKALAIAYQTQAALGTTATAEQYQAGIADLNAKTDVLEELCAAYVARG